MAKGLPLKPFGPGIAPVPVPKPQPGPGRKSKPPGMPDKFTPTPNKKTP